MPVRKFAISMPEEVMKQVDRAAAARGITRSRFIADVLKKAAQARTDAEITRRINEVLADPLVAEQLREDALALQRAGSKTRAKW